MKSKLLMALLLSAVTACAALSGCAQPADGKSAYDIWLSAGNSGTEKEFLEWLKGQDGKDGVDGQNGTNGKDGKDGEDGKYGVGLSGTAGGAMMILTGTELGASNNLFVGYQYAYGCSISFAIVSDATVSDAKITLRLSAEYRDISIDTQSYLIELNGEPLTYDIEFKDVPSPDGQPIDINTIYALPFSDYVIAEDVTLREGVNVITLTTNNYDALAGTTMLAAAPLIDCLKIKTSATLEWSEADGYPADNY